MHRRRFLLSLPPALLAAATAVASAPTARFPRISPVPGGVARVELGATPHPPRVRMGGKPVLVVRDGGEWIALVGIALSTQAGSRLKVEAERADGTVALHGVTVARKDYPSEHLKVPP